MSRRPGREKAHKEREKRKRKVKYRTHHLYEIPEEELERAARLKARQRARKVNKDWKGTPL